jgi:hypothetical protein
MIIAQYLFQLGRLGQPFDVTTRPRPSAKHVFSGVEVSGYLSQSPKRVIVN